MTIHCKDCGKELKKRFENDDPVWCSECERKRRDEFDRQLDVFAAEQNAKLAFQAWHDEMSE